ncbi:MULTISPECIES: GIY-YIG nuclease family protein [unclassified Minwuia]|uniref:GIY-YIG nuclease family protein n=1 Tax=unclassified Minwuia TaxID=2618799 RepID=UPI00247A15B2|nr:MULTISPECIES: GIY-YIG nuclease family protein [unclassified Minwuia]
MLASRRNGTLYIGVSRDLRRRLGEHRTGWSQFTDRYQIHRLVWFETHESVVIARQRERTLKHWKRDWKLQLIEARNPDWRDLAGEIPFD